MKKFNEMIENVINEGKELPPNVKDFFGVSNDFTLDDYDWKVFKGVPIGMARDDGMIALLNLAEFDKIIEKNLKKEGVSSISELENVDDFINNIRVSYDKAIILTA